MGIYQELLKESGCTENLWIRATLERVHEMPLREAFDKMDAGIPLREILDESNQRVEDALKAYEAVTK